MSEPQQGTSGPRRYRFGLHGQPWYWRQRARTDYRPASRVDRPIKFQSLADVCLDPVIEPDNLLAAFRLLEEEGGPAPGPDGVGFRHLGRQERRAALRTLHQALKDGSWRPGPTREVRVPKATGGTRTLRIRNLLDRIVSKAITTAITPALDALLPDCALGFRPGRSHLDLLARLAAQVECRRLTVVVEDDIRQAFDHVPLTPTVALFRERIPDERVADLIEGILRGDQGRRREVAIDQGDPLSPLALNLLLSHVLDGPTLSAFPHVPFWRYADNLIACCQDVSEGRDLLQGMSTTLQQAGFQLKGTNPVNLLREGTRVNILGFRLSWKNDKVIFQVGDKGMRCLLQSLNDAHGVAQPTVTARRICEGWLSACGPAFENAGDVSTFLQNLRQTVSCAGFQEIGSEEFLPGAIRESRTRWLCIRGTARRETEGNLSGGFSGGQGAAHPRANADHPSAVVTGQSGE